MGGRHFSHYEAQAQTVNLEDITSSDDNAAILQKLRADDPEFTSLGIKVDYPEDDDDFIVRREDDMDISLRKILRYNIFTLLTSTMRSCQCLIELGSLLILRVSTETGQLRNCTSVQILGAKISDGCVISFGITII
jgi:hypothetical protein